MNRRQKKKAYKKKYGHNPPKTEAKYHSRYWGKVAAKQVAASMEAIGEVVRALVPAIQEALNTFCRITKEAIEHIKTMPEEDFNRFLESEEVDERAKALARQIRRRANHE